MNGKNRSDCWYSSDGIEWHEIPDSPFLPRHAASVAVHNDGLFLAAGNAINPDGSWTVSDVWRLQRGGPAVPAETRGVLQGDKRSPYLPVMVAAPAAAPKL
eukprot:SAG22_NODE_1073_length_5696_cov_4.682687_2_plen_101_part_00